MRETRFELSGASRAIVAILSNGKDVRFLDSPGFPVGLTDDVDFTAHTAALPQPFSLLLVSDGVLELLAADPDGDRQELLLQRIGDGHFEIGRVVDALAVDERRQMPDDVTFLLASNAR